MRRWPLVVALLLFASAGVWWVVRAPSFDGGLHKELERRGRVVVVGDPGLVGTAVDGTTLVAPGPLASALEGRDEAALLAAMRDADVEALLVAQGGRLESNDAALEAQLRSYRPLEQLRAVYLTPTHALYAPGIRSDLGESGEALPRIARAILEGEAPPRISRFPEPLRRIRSVEVMVLLRDAGQARLWRSARGSSIARALVTASVVARQRWAERSEALGGPLPRRLPLLDVEVSLLEEDGTLGTTSPAFVERSFFAEHGVAYERPGVWRYLLPEATRSAGNGSAVKAYESLFADNALPTDSLRRRDMRFYRLLTTVVGLAGAGTCPRRDGLDVQNVIDVVDVP
ncbi:MAG: hypothetical protein R3B99_12265 [Polyangiales bacterium]